MFPDTVPSPKAAEAFEAELRLLDLPEVPGSLDARMQELLAKPPVAAGIPKRGFLNKELPWIVAVSGLAACAVLVVRMAPQPASAPAKSIAAATPGNPPEITPPPVRHMEAPVLDCAIPVGYQYQGSRALYAEETPVGTVRQPDGTPMRAWQRKSMLRHTYANPATHATFEVDVPRETVVLEDLPSY